MGNPSFRVKMYKRLCSCRDVCERQCVQGGELCGHGAERPILPDCSICAHESHRTARTRLSSSVPTHRIWHSLLLSAFRPRTTRTQIDGSRLGLLWPNHDEVVVPEREALAHVPRQPLLRAGHVDVAPRLRQRRCHLGRVLCSLCVSSRQRGGRARKVSATQGRRQRGQRHSVGDKGPATKGRR